MPVKPPKVFTPLLEACGKPTELSRILGKNANTVAAWYARDRLPPEYWDDVVEVARSLGAETVTYEALRAANAVAAQRKRARRTGGKPVRSLPAAAALRT